MPSGFRDDLVRTSWTDCIDGRGQRISGVWVTNDRVGAIALAGQLKNVANAGLSERGHTGGETHT